MWKPIESAPLDGTQVMVWDGKTRAEIGFVAKNGNWIICRDMTPKFWASIDDIPPGLKLSNSAKIKVRMTMRAVYVSEDGTEAMSETMTGAFKSANVGECIEVDEAVLRCQAFDFLTRVVARAKKF